MEARQRIEAGWAAYDRDGTRLGDVERVDDGEVVISPTARDREHVRVPLAAVASVDPDAGVIRVDAAASRDAPRTSPDPARNDGVDGLGFTGRDQESSADPVDDGVEGLGFTGRDDADEADDPRH